MRTVRTLLLVAIMLATAACASNTVQQRAAAPTAEILPAPAAVAVFQPDAPPGSVLATPLAQDAASATETTAEAGSVAAAENSSQVELDADVNDMPELVRDPWEGFNRKVHSFNNTADEFVLRPVAVGYKRIVPESVQAGVFRFFANLSMPATIVNQALQGRPGDAVKSLGRFAINTTIGIVGMFDPASHFDMPMGDEEDFGQTLATWGWRDSRYLVLPLLGPHTVRDTIGIVGDWPLSPISQIQDSGAATGLQLLGIVDMRTQLLPTDQFRREALDDYLFVRDAWAQRRKHQIQQDLGSK